MSGVRLRPRSLFSSTPFSSLSRHLSSIISHHISSRFVLIVVTVLPLSLAALGFFLQLGSGGGGIFNEFIDQQQYELLRKLQRNSSVELKCNRNNVVDRNLTFPYFKEWRFWFNGNGSDQERLEQSQTKICITTSTSAGLEQVLPWIMYHKLIGISHFFIFVEGKAASPTVGGVLETIPGVKVVYRTPELEELQMKSRIWNETWLEDFFYKPCNYELFVKQNLNMEMGIVMAREAGMEWIFHLDTDELVYPAGTLDYSVTTLLADIPEPVHVVIFSNYETAVERDDIKEPFGEISLFKKSYDHLTHEIYNQTYDDATRGNPNYFLTYGNGKSAARIRDTLRPNGAHRWYSYDDNQNEMEFTEAAVLHYTYSKFSDLTSRRDRCNCKPTQEDLERCFMLEFDRNAFIVASTSTEEEMLQWYNDHVVWRDINLKKKLLKNSVLTRIYTPMVMIQTLKESGVFTSIIESANKLMMNNKTSQSEEEEEDEGSKRSRTVSFLADPKPSHDDDDAGKFRVEPRRSDVSRAAVPPLSPPTLEELSLRNNKLGIHRQGLR